MMYANSLFGLCYVFFIKSIFKSCMTQFRFYQHFLGINLPIRTSDNEARSQNPQTSLPLLPSVLKHIVHSCYRLTQQDELGTVIELYHVGYRFLNQV